ncbi:MAG: phosphatase PAP2 family protein [Candidatus Paceibacterota bacterium]|jgi:undecaprenyl-diphosphatase
MEFLISSLLTLDTSVANFFFELRNAELISFFSWVTLLGEWQVVVIGAVVVSLLLWLWPRRFYIIPLWITIISSEIFTFLAKLAFHRPRPELAYYLENDFSFPSGHATIAVAFYGFLAYILFRETKSRGQKVIAILGGLIIILAIGLSRLYLGVHYFSDIGGGYLSGALGLIIGITLFDLCFTLKKETVEQPKP